MGWHLVLSLVSTRNPALQAAHCAVVASHLSQPNWQAVHDPAEERKNPVSQAEHLLSVPSIQPWLQAHEPSGLHSPLTQLHCLGSVGPTLIEKHCPVPDMPSSQSVHPSGQGLQSTPKCPAAHDSQDDPEKLGGQTHWPEALQMPVDEHAGVHAVDWRSRRFNEDKESWAMSGTDSQRTTRLALPLPEEETATQTFSEMASELAGIGVDEFWSMG